MKKFIVLFVCLLSSTSLFSQKLTDTETLRLKEIEQKYSDNINVFFEYAWLLYRQGGEENCLKADDLINQVTAAQDQDPESITFGQWGWKWENGEKVVDFNNALFKAHWVFNKLWDFQNKMSLQTKEKFITCSKNLLEAAVRRWDTEVFDIGRDFVNYSNIFVLYVETFTMAGERFDNYRIKKMAKSQWTRWYNHIYFYGIDEFASPTYNRVVFSHLFNIYDFCHDERIQKEVKEVMDYIYLLQSALTHPVLKIPVTGISRDYRNFLINNDARSGVFDNRLWKLHPAPKSR